MRNKSQNIIQFTILYNRYKEGLYNYCIKMLNNRSISQDIIQNVFLKLFQNMNSINNFDSISYWLFKTTRNEIFSYLRKKKVKNEHLEYYDINENENIASDNTNYYYEYEKQELKNIVLNELKKIPLEQSEPFLLKEYSGLSYKEIASIMEIDEELVKSRLYKTRQKLIKQLENIFDKGDFL
ncbi:MAG: RNA polymerase sigma factor [Ignavibacteriaceae bacterium]|nr:RNA polymerase sigma factor [Ignavibacteriaceae bacterium]